MAQDHIADPETGKIVAIIRNGEVFRDDTEGEKIATALGAYLYDLKGNLVGPWIPERSATRLREADLNVFSKLGK